MPAPHIECMLTPQHDLRGAPLPAPAQTPGDTPDDSALLHTGMALFDLLHLQGQATHSQRIQHLLEVLTARGCSQATIDLYTILAPLISSLVLDRQTQLAQASEPTRRRPGPRGLSEREFLDRRTAALRALGAGPDYIPSRRALAEQMGLSEKTLRRYAKRYAIPI